jgi:proton-dependent oligopeptide transporter, POT family
VIAFVELAERFSYYGSTIVFTNFIQQPLPSRTGKATGDGQPGALGMGQQASTGINTFNSFWKATSFLLLLVMLTDLF